MRPLRATDDADAELGQLRQDAFVEYRVLPLDLPMCDLADLGQHAAWRHAVLADQLMIQRDLALQPGHPNLEELVHVAREDQQELQPFQQRRALVQRLVQHADIELQLRQLAVDIQPAVVKIPRHGWRHGIVGGRCGGIGRQGLTDDASVHRYIP